MGLTKNPATALLAMNGLDVLPNSAVSLDGTEAGLVASGQRVAILAPSGSQVLSSFEGESSATGGRTLLLGPMSAANLGALHDLMPWLRPRPLGTRTSAGFGDRLGLALRTTVQPRPTPSVYRRRKPRGSSPVPSRESPAVRKP